MFHLRFCRQKKQHDQTIFEQQLLGARQSFPLVMEKYDQMQEKVESLPDPDYPNTPPPGY